MLQTKYPFIALMPQWDFLNFLRESGKRFPSLKVMMQAEANDLLRRGDRIAGVKATTPEGAARDRGRPNHRLRRPPLDWCGNAQGSRSRKSARRWTCCGFAPARRPDETENVFARIEPGKMMVTFDRGDYWQCAYVIAKGQFDAVKARGLQALLDDVVRMAPVLKAGISDVKSWDDVKLLTVAINRLKRWTLPGLLCIGDAAHAMSPIGGVGVNLAVQDAVATANLLAAKLAYRLHPRKTNSTPCRPAANFRCG